MDYVPGVVQFCNDSWIEQHQWTFRIETVRYYAEAHFFQQEIFFSFYSPTQKSLNFIWQPFVIMLKNTFFNRNAFFNFTVLHKKAQELWKLPALEKIPFNYIASLNKYFSEGHALQYEIYEEAEIPICHRIKGMKHEGISSVILSSCQYSCPLPRKENRRCKDYSGWI